MLTPKQERFCQKYIEIGNASEAYRMVYDAANMSVGSVNVEANQLMGNPKITLRLKNLQDKHSEHHNITVSSLTNELEEARKIAANMQLPASMISATMGKAKMHGFLEKGNKKNGEIQFVLVDETDMKF